MKNKLFYLFILIQFLLTCTEKKKDNLLLYSLLLLPGTQLQNYTRTEAPRTFQTSFESIEDFKQFYIVPKNYHNTTDHELSSELFYSGKNSHKAWIYNTYTGVDTTNNNNHRAYPTIQFQKTSSGPYICPCYISLMVWLDISLKSKQPENEWFSFATITHDTSDKWYRTVTVNLSYDGFVHLMHVPNQGQQDRIFQTNSISFPMKQWVQLKIYVAFDANGGYVKVWQNGVLVSHAKTLGTDNRISQLHFGMYAPPSISSGVIYNDDLIIKEVTSESDL